MEEHILKFEVDAKWSSFSESQVTLAPSLKYTGMNDEPPRLMGEGFVVLSSNTIDFYYYMDEPGIVPEVPLMIELANGDVVECHAPVWGLDIRCGKGTDFSYGPWADRKREQLFKYFYPPDYQPMKVGSLFIILLCPRPKLVLFFFYLSRLHLLRDQAKKGPCSHSTFALARWQKLL